MVTAEGYAKAGVPYRVDRPSFLILRVFFPSHGNLYGKENPRLKGRRQFLCAQTRRSLPGCCSLRWTPASCCPLLRLLRSVPGDPGSRGIPLRYARDLAPARFVANAPACEALIRSAALEGVFASSLDVRYSRTSALALPPRKAPLTPLLRLLRAVDLANGRAGAGSPP